MIVSIIVAVAKNGVIGKDNKLPWKLSGDLRHFKQLTLGHHVIMGRKSFDAVGKPLEGRVNIVISRNRGLRLDGALVMHSVKEAIHFCEEVKELEAFVIGGAEIVKQALPLADKMYLTHIDAEPQGDTFFPEWNAGDWKVISETEHDADEKNQYPFTIKVYQRK